jgi:hypothetical protein
MCRIYALLITSALTVIGATAAEMPQAGALARDGKWEVSVDFPPEVARNSIVQIGNYSLPGTPSIVTIDAIRYVPQDNAAVLTVSGLVTNDLYSVKIENLLDTAGKDFPDISVSFRARAMSWAEIGARELVFAPDVVSVGETGFDLISGGSEMWGRYDESTFAYEVVTGNFDKLVRVHMQEPSSALARAGIMVRETLDDGKRRPVDPSNPDEAFSRYLQVHVNPAGTAYGDAGNNLYQINIRYFTGGIGGTNFDATINPEITNNVAPPYTNAWLRLKRVGDVFETFRGNDGTNWIQIGTFSFPTNNVDGGMVPKFPETVYLGLNYSAEVGNIPDSTGERRSFMAQFREYGNTGALDLPVLIIARDAGAVRLEWQGGGTLLSNTNLATEFWTPVQGASPVTVPLVPEKPKEFFRVRIP